MKKTSSFLAGMATALLIVSLTTSALAASGNVSFSFANVAVDGKTQITAGSTITAPNGQQIPGSILYTDEAGGKTNYLPIRAISDLLGVEISYDSATKTVYLGKQSTSYGKWQLEIDGKKILYFCDEEDHTYSAPLTYRPAWTKDSVGLKSIRHDTRNYTTTWEYVGDSGTIMLQCAYPSTAGFARQMNSEDAIKNRQTLTVQGNTADYYQDGDHSLLVWENADGILFFMRGTDVSRELLTEVAESVKPCTEKVAEYSLEWLPKGYSRLDHYAIADTVDEVWLKDGVGLTWMYSASPVAVPAGTPETVTVNGAKARFWPAEEPYKDDGSMTVNGQEENGHSASAGGLTVTSGTIPSVLSKTANTLVWSKGGINFRLISILDKDTMIRIAENVQ